MFRGCGACLTSNLSCASRGGIRRKRVCESWRRTNNHELCPLLDPKAVHPGADLVTAAHLGVSGGEGVEEGAVATAEVAHADVPLRVGRYFEMLARKELVRDAHM